MKVWKPVYFIFRVHYTHAERPMTADNVSQSPYIIRHAPVTPHVSHTKKWTLAVCYSCHTPFVRRRQSQATRFMMPRWWPRDGCSFARLSHVAPVVLNDGYIKLSISPTYTSKHASRKRPITYSTNVVFDLDGDKPRPKSTRKRRTLHRRFISDYFISLRLRP